MSAGITERALKAHRAFWEPGDFTNYAVTVIEVSPANTEGKVTVIIDSPNGVDSPIALMDYHEPLTESWVKFVFGISNDMTVTHITALLCHVLDIKPVGHESSAMSLARLKAYYRNR